MDLALTNHQKLIYQKSQTTKQPTSVSGWFSTRVRVIASLLTFPGLFLVFWPISVMLLFGWFLLVLLFPSLPVPVPILW